MQQPYTEGGEDTITDQPGTDQPGWLVFMRWLVIGGLVVMIGAMITIASVIFVRLGDTRPALPAEFDIGALEPIAISQAGTVFYIIAQGDAGIVALEMRADGTETARAQFVSD